MSEPVSERTKAADFVDEWRAAEAAIVEAIQVSLNLFAKRTGAEVRAVEVGLERIATATHNEPTRTRTNVMWVHLAITSGGRRG